MNSPRFPWWQSPRAFFALAGLSFGSILAGAGFAAAGAGHGTFVLIGLGSAPLALANNVNVALIGTPFLWAAIGFLLSRADRWIAATALVVCMLAHYGTLPFVLRRPSPFADWSYAERQKVFVVTIFCIYAVAQVAMWFTFVVLIRRAAKKGPATS